MKRSKTRIIPCERCKRILIVKHKVKAKWCKRCFEFLKRNGEFDKRFIVPKRVRKIEKLEEEIFACNKCNRKDVCYSIPGTSYVNKTEIIVVILGLKYKQLNIKEEMFHENFNRKISRSRIYRCFLRTAELGTGTTYFTTLIKCPIYNRKNLRSKAEKCLSFLQRQIEIVKPKLIITFGGLIKEKVVDKNAKYFTFINKDNICYLCLPKINDIMNFSNVDLALWASKIKTKIQELKGITTSCQEASERWEKRLEQIRKEKEENPIW